MRAGVPSTGSAQVQSRSSILCIHRASGRRNHRGCCNRHIESGRCIEVGMWSENITVDIVICEFTGLLRPAVLRISMFGTMPRRWCQHPEIMHGSSISPDAEFILMLDQSCAP